MKRNMGHFALVFFVVAAFLVQGCTELKKLNARQAIAIRYQTTELEKLEAELDATNTKLDAANKLNRVYEDRAKSDAEVKARLRSELERLARSIGGGAAVRDTAEGPMIQLPETILFDSGLAKLKTKGEIALEKIAKHLSSHPTAMVRIDGHTDNDPIVKSKYLWESNHHLSAGRALSVLHYLVSKGKIEESRIHIAGYGPNRPISSNKTKAGKMQNRRVEFLILSPESS